MKTAIQGKRNDSTKLLKSIYTRCKDAFLSVPLLQILVFIFTSTSKSALYPPNLRLSSSEVFRSHHTVSSPHNPPHNMSTHQGSSTTPNRHDEHSPAATSWLTVHRPWAVQPPQRTLQSSAKPTSPTETWLLQEKADPYHTIGQVRASGPTHAASGFDAGNGWRIVDEWAGRKELLTILFLLIASWPPTAVV
jgi:hypothetical protein